jgi:hypothetical protein
MVRSASGSSRTQEAEIENGLVLTNLGADLVLERLLVREWDGKVPMARPMDRSFVETLGGVVHSGKVTAVKEGRVVVKGDGGAVELALDEVAWVRVAAMKGEKAATDLPTYGCPVTEAVLLGVLAERNAGDWIEWDAAAGKVTNRPELNAQLSRKYRDGWSVEGLG